MDTINKENNFSILEDIFEKIYVPFGGNLEAYSGYIRNSTISVPEELKKFIVDGDNKIVVPFSEINKSKKDSVVISNDILNLFSNAFHDFQRDVVVFTPEILIKKRFTKDKNEFKLAKAILEYYSNKKGVVKRTRDSIRISVKNFCNATSDYSLAACFPNSWRANKSPFNSTDFITLISKFLERSFTILERSNGIVFSDSDFLVISWDIVDSSFAAEGNSFTSCMKFYENKKNICFNEAGNLNRVVVYVTDGSKKSFSGLESYKMKSRSFAFLGDSEANNGRPYYLVTKSYGSNSVGQFVDVLSFLFKEVDFYTKRNLPSSENKYRSKYDIDFSFLPRDYHLTLPYYDECFVAVKNCSTSKQFDAEDEKVYNLEDDILKGEDSISKSYYINFSSNGGFCHYTPPVKDLSSLKDLGLISKNYDSVRVEDFSPSFAVHGGETFVELSFDPESANIDQSYFLSYNIENKTFKVTERRYNQEVNYSSFIDTVSNNIKKRKDSFLLNIRKNLVKQVFHASYDTNAFQRILLSRSFPCEKLESMISDNSSQKLYDILFSTADIRLTSEKIEEEIPPCFRFNTFEVSKEDDIEMINLPIKKYIIPIALKEDGSYFDENAKKSDILCKYFNDVKKDTSLISKSLDFGDSNIKDSLVKILNIKRYSLKIDELRQEIESINDLSRVDRRVLEETTPYRLLANLVVDDEVVFTA